MSSRESRAVIRGSAPKKGRSKENPPLNGERLNVVVCGSDGSLKSSISELIQQQTHRRSESVRTDVDLLLNVLELPALFNTGLSEEEVMRQTLRCVSLCHPGVHAFLLIIPDAPLNNQDRAEMEEIKRIFSSRINKHLMILIKQNSEHQTAELNEETQAVIESFGGRHHFCGPKTLVSTLMENIEQMLEENRGGFFSTETFLEAQMKKLMKYEEMKKNLNSLETNLLTKGSLENTDDEMRIVLLGKTGVGKSATGNTILGRKAFKAETSFESVTKVSLRESCKISGRQVTVIDTPGLFDTELTNEEIQREIRHCISMILPGPHVFLLLIPLGRFTKEEETSVKIIQETFGENSLMFTMVLFTRGDDLGNKTITQCLGKAGSPLMNLIEACGNRFHVFNNNQTEDRTQVSDLLEKIDNMVKANGGSFYSCKMFREMERERKEQQMKILMDRVRNAEEEMKKLEEEKDRMKTMMEEERQNHESEKKRREEELKREIREEEKHQREIRDHMKRERETFRHKIEKMRKENEKIKTEKDNLRTAYQTETDRLMNRIENEKKKREEEYTEKEEQYKTLIKEKAEKELKEEMRKEKDKLQIKYHSETDRLMNRIENEKKKREKEYTEKEEQYKILIKEKEKELKEEMRKEKEKLQIKYHSETNRLMNRIENERQNHETERKRREEEFNEREERYKRLMKEREEREENMQEEMKREREECEKLKEEEKKRREEDEKRREKEQRELNKRLKEERERMEREKEDLQSKIKEEENKMKMMMDRARKTEEEMKKLEEKNRMKMMMEERQNQDRERKRREEEFRAREERYKRLIKEKEESEKNLHEEKKREQEKFRHELWKEKEKPQTKYDIERLMNRLENERKTKEHLESEEQKAFIKVTEKKETEMKRKQENWEKLKQEEKTIRAGFEQKRTHITDLAERSKQTSSMTHQRLQRIKYEDLFGYDLRLLLIGKTGSGKSATGNVLFNAPVFESRMSSSSVTRVCQKHTGAVHNRRVTVVDTPDFRYSTHTDFDSESELKRALQLSAAGAHVILIFLPLSTLIEQEMEFFQWFEQMFGSEAFRFTLVLFTHAGKPHLRTLGELISRNTQLANFINRCGWRYHEFNIKAPANSQQVMELMEKVERLVSENGNTCYTLQMLEEAEKRRKEEEKRREKERREKEHQMMIEAVRQETEIRVRRENEEKRRAIQLEEQRKKLICIILLVCFVFGIFTVAVSKGRHPP